ncbi:WD40 repeat domain-containing protein [Streptomyces pseudovenezuelae]|uniref:WD40 repeat protein n=1 Tax=Streptomyces pseudovenezuelae TaxID=67350 RepID=A0ABT6M2R4_9ACTN|nr:WD40 repeat domain-containing protein [Streptomyces pseudovenezuelae]MDH6222833.1 WD40 repeat protein [Streptomyces pseudovenezuelae]
MRRGIRGRESTDGSAGTESTGSEPEVTAAPELFELCRAAVQQEPTAALDALDRIQQRVSARQTPAAAAVLAVARALCDHDRARQRLSPALEYWRSAELLPQAWPTVVRQDTSAETPTRLAVVLGILSGPDSGPAEAFAALVACTLADAPTASIVAETESTLTGITDDSGAESGNVPGEVRLMLAVLDDGPAGIHPDPARMALLRATASFASAVRDAWRASSLAEHERCVLWAAEQANGTPVATADQALGEAFGPALAVLENRRAASGRWLPDGLRQLPHLLSSSWRNAGHRPRRAATAVVGAVTATALILLGLTLGGWRHGPDSAAVADRLAARALSAEDQNPQLAAQLALAAYRIHPDEQTAGLLRRISEDDAFVARRINTGTGKLTALAQDDRRQLVFTAGPKGGVRVWSLWSGKQLGRVGKSSAVVALASAPDAPLLVGADNSGNVLLWRTGDLSRISAPVRLAKPAADGSGVRTVGLGFTDDGRSIFWVAGTGEIRVWNARTHSGHTSWLTNKVNHGALPATAVSNPYARWDGSAPHILIGSEDEGVFSFDLGTRLFKNILGASALRGRATALAAESIGDTLTVTVGTSAGLAGWTLGHTRHETFPYAAINRYVNALAVRGNGTLAVATDRGTELITDDGSLLTSRPQGGYAGGFGVPSDPAGQSLSVGGSGDTVCILTVSGAGLAPATGGASTVLAYDRSGNLLLSDPDNDNRTRHMYTVRPNPRDPGRHASDTTHRRTFGAKKSWWESTSTFYANGAALTPSLAAVAGQDPDGQATVLVWNARTGQPLRHLVFPDDSTEDGATSPSGVPNIAVSVALDPRLHLLIARDAAGKVAAWSTRTWRQAFHISTGATKGSSMALSPDGRTLVLPMGTGRPDDIGSSNSLAFVDLRSHKLNTVSLSRWANEVAYAPDGAHIAILSGDDTVTFLDRAGHPAPGTPVIALPGPATGIAYSPDGRHLAVGDVLSRVLVFGTSDGQLAYPAFQLPEGQSAVDVAFDPTGTLLTADGGILGPHPQALSTYFWTLDPTNWADRVCALAGGGMSRASWAQYISTASPYDHLCA